MHSMTEWRPGAADLRTMDRRDWMKVGSASLAVVGALLAARRRSGLARVVALVTLATAVAGAVAVARETALRDTGELQESDRAEE